MTKTSLQIARGTRTTESPDQARFAFLIREIEKTRREQATLDANLLKYRQQLTETMGPLRASLRKTVRETIMQLDQLLDMKGWSRVDMVSLRQVLQSTAQSLLEATPDDAEVRAVFDKHSDVSFDGLKEQELERLKEQAEELTGVDLSEADIRSEDDLVQRMYEEMEARRGADEAARFDSQQRRRKSSAQQRAEDNAAQARQTIREIYRKLASAVHPDREPDPTLRDEKNALMQKINQAYAANDLLTLFEAQLQLQQLDASDIASVSGERLKHYNKLLSEQLNELRNSLRELEADFCRDHGLPPQTGLSQVKFSKGLRELGRAIRNEIAQQREFVELLGSKTAVKRWLRMQRRWQSEVDDEDE